MKPTILKTLAVVACVAALSGCHKHTESGHEEGHSHNADGSHSDSAESFSGATHKEGTGITLLEETRKRLDIQTADVQEQNLPRQIRFQARVFNIASSGTLVSGAASTNDTALLQRGQSLEFQTSSGLTITGTIQQVSHPVANSEAEIVAVLHPTAALRLGDFGEITVAVPGAKTALVVPREAVIKGTTGDLVYAVNGDAYTLTWVGVGAEANGFVEITDGLFAGDSVVTRGVMDLWLVELRAVKGGQGCCPAPPKKGKS